jgi:hypothetical protein
MPSAGGEGDAWGLLRNDIPSADEPDRAKRSAGCRWAKVARPEQTQVHLVGDPIMISVLVCGGLKLDRSGGRVPAAQSWPEQTQARSALRRLSQGKRHPPRAIKAEPYGGLTVDQRCKPGGGLKMDRSEEGCLQPKLAGAS